MSKTELTNRDRTDSNNIRNTALERSASNSITDKAEVTESNLKSGYYYMSSFQIFMILTRDDPGFQKLEFDYLQGR